MSMKKNGVYVCAVASLVQVLTGCGSEVGGDTAALEVQSLSVQGVIEGRSIDEPAEAVRSGERFDSLNWFYLDGPTVTAQITTCADDDLENPYDRLPDGGGSVERPAPGVGSCTHRQVMVCFEQVCTDFSDDQIDIETREENGWRRVVLDGSNAISAIQVELVYRERS